VIAVVNQEGRSGQDPPLPSTWLPALALEGLPTLLIDCDPQSNTPEDLAWARSESRLSIYDVLMGSATLEETLLPT